MTTESSAELVIPSQVRLVDLVHCAAEKMADIAGFAAEQGLDIGLAVREAAINAIRHGNREDSALQVRILLEVLSDGIRVEIRDQGEGFDPDAAPDPTDEDNLLRTSGRGLLLIRAFVDDVRIEFEKGRGTTVTLVKKRQGDGSPSEGGDGDAGRPGEES
jgi:serine/threonine-protein kinase RsbW